jgi:lipopolysaccharide transport system ATP-binding protein
VSFDVAQGEVVGIVGRNGAGKSTLLKVLSRITEPTTGSIELTGRVASLLEVGTGFHGELTGRENIFLNGAILGMTRSEVRARFDEIVAFAEVEQFLDTPVKHYSSGMYLRLAFAVAAHLESEILVVDEVLAVGDASFQKKCLGKMEETSHQGRTILFVSHNLAAVNQLCQRAVWLAQGSVEADGPAFDVVAKYLSFGDAIGFERAWQDSEHAPGDHGVRLVGARLRQNGDVVGVVDINRPVSVEIDLELRTRSKNLVASFFVNDAQGATLFASCDWRPNQLDPGRYRWSATIPGRTLAEGRMSVLLQAFYFEPHRVCFHEPDVLHFDAADSAHPRAVRGPYRGPWPGAVRLDIEWGDPVQVDEGVDRRKLAVSETSR